jgi:hypothetical protein
MLDLSAICAASICPIALTSQGFNVAIRCLVGFDFHRRAVVGSMAQVFPNECRDVSEVAASELFLKLDEVVVLMGPPPNISAIATPGLRVSEPHLAPSDHGPAVSQQQPCPQTADPAFVAFGVAPAPAANLTTHQAKYEPPGR